MEPRRQRPERRTGRDTPDHRRPARRHPQRRPRGDGVPLDGAASTLPAVHGGRARSDRVRPAGRRRRLVATGVPRRTVAAVPAPHRPAARRRRGLPAGHGNDAVAVACRAGRLDAARRPADMEAAGAQLHRRPTRRGREPMGRGDVLPALGGGGGRRLGGRGTLGTDLPRRQRHVGALAGGGLRAGRYDGRLRLAPRRARRRQPRGAQGPRRQRGGVAPRVVRGGRPALSAARRRGAGARRLAQRVPTLPTRRSRARHGRAGTVPHRGAPPAPSGRARRVCLAAAVARRAPLRRAGDDDSA